MKRKYHCIEYEEKIILYWGQKSRVQVHCGACLNLILLPVEKKKKKRKYIILGQWAVNYGPSNNYRSRAHLLWRTVRYIPSMGRIGSGPPRLSLDLKNSDYRYLEYYILIQFLFKEGIIFINSIENMPAISA